METSFESSPRRMPGRWKTWRYEARCLLITHADQVTECIALHPAAPFAHIKYSYFNRITLHNGSVNHLCAPGHTHTESPIYVLLQRLYNVKQNNGSHKVTEHGRELYLKVTMAIRKHSRRTLQPGELGISAMSQANTKSKDSTVKCTTPKAICIVRRVRKEHPLTCSEFSLFTVSRIRKNQN